MSHPFLARVHPPNHLRTFRLLLPTRSLTLTICPLDPPQLRHLPLLPRISPLMPSSSHSYNDACQEFNDLRPALRIPQAINQTLLEHCRLLHMIPFVDATHQNQMHQEFQEELNSLLRQALEAYPKEDITGIVSKYLEKK
ncbi:hypothetical protein O181_027655 [Austropuccinia psidii MF-1]|uniref:Uncharacterized protein n=1 Tax=Austropuccinia psidii MF-1 TaxID=1389203 RepID=A0A9Q3CRS9_9BASI|nr:hypothetical protein [Austropuccinia psidii MF-1]